MKKYLLLVALLSGKYIFAQYTDEALMYSRSGVTGTARTAGSSGAFGSVGADLGSVTVNPAGLGLYRSTDICVTPSLVVGSNESQFDGSFKSQSSTKLSFSQAGIAFTKLFKKPGGNSDFSFNSTRVNSISFAINYQRQAGFGRTESFDGYNTSNSGIDAYTYYANATGQPLTTDNYPVEMVLARSANLIGYDSVTGNYFSNVHSPLHQSGIVSTKGGADQINLAFGGNVNDKFYFGIGLGIPILTYFNDAQFSESNTTDSTSGFRDYTFGSSLRSTGLAVNAQFGIIYRPVTWMRLGIAYHMPTFYSITETYSSYMTTNFDTSYSSQSADAYPFKYKLRTPMKGTVSASFYLKEHGFFSVDYEFQNYGASRFNFGTDEKGFTDQVNAEEKKNFAFGHVVRAGFEGAYKTLRVRAGYAFSSTPYKKDAIVKGFAAARHNASLGIGYRGNRFYADFAYVLGFTKDDNQPYADFDVKNTLLSHNMLLTLGFKISKDPAAATQKKRERSNPPPPNF